MMSDMPQFRPLRDLVEIQVSPDGLRIELIESKARGFFESGSSVLSDTAGRLLGIMASQLNGLGESVVIEGHTDRRPYVVGAPYGNWELSTDRAHAARRALEGGGLLPTRIRAVRGYADTLLRMPADPFDPRNRRVSIVVAGPGAAKLVPPADGSVRSRPGPVSDIRH